MTIRERKVVADPLDRVEHPAEERVLGRRRCPSFRVGSLDNGWPGALARGRPEVHGQVTQEPLVPKAVGYRSNTASESSVSVIIGPQMSRWPKGMSAGELFEEGPRP